MLDLVLIVACYYFAYRLRFEGETLDHFLPYFTASLPVVLGCKLASLYALKWDAAIQTDKLDVMVSHGYVTLKGEVEWPFQREAAERVVRRLAGVKGVTNWVTVAPHASPGDIQQKIERALVRNATIDAHHITVEVLGHTATLRGQVRSFAEKLAAERTALAAPGITTVNNEIKIVYEG